MLLHKTAHLDLLNIIAILTQFMLVCPTIRLKANVYKMWDINFEKNSKP